MSDYLYLEMELVAHSFLLGIVLIVSYDLLRLFRLLIPHKNLVVGVEDLLYWNYSAWMTFRMLFYENGGILRGYVIISIFTAMILYDRIVSQTVFGVLKKGKRWFTIKVRGLFDKVRQRRRKKKVRSYGTES